MRGPPHGRTRPRRDPPPAWPSSWRDGAWHYAFGFSRLVPVRARRPQTCSSWLARCNELGASAPAVHSGLSCSARCAGAPRPRRTSAVVPWRVSRVRGSTHATCGCFADAHSDTVQRIARRCHEWTWDSVQCRATMLWACGQRRCIACTLWTDRTCVRAVFCEIWVTLLRAGPCIPCKGYGACEYTPYYTRASRY